MLLLPPAGHATRPPEALKETLKKTFPSARVRLDGVIENSDGTLYIPLIPKTLNTKVVPGVSAKYPAQGTILYAFSNGWYYLKLVDKGGKKILALPALKDDEKKKVVACSLPTDLIVPNNMFVGPELKSAIGELQIAILDGTTAATTTTATAQPTPPPKESGQQPVAKPDTVSSEGIVAVTSPQTGKIAMLGNGLNKLVELPTDGTPGGMAIANKKLFIADQTKNRVLIVDPQTREFAGQIDFPPGSSPKDVASQADGTFLYVSECAANKIAIVELATQKILMHTLVPAGPTRIKITPNGYTLVVLNVPAGKVSFISTLNQKLVGVLAVGGMPSDVIISNDSRTAYVSNRLSNTISVLDITQKKVVKTLPTGEGPTGLALSKDGGKLFVANAKDNSISVFDLSNYSKIKDITLPIDVEFPSDIMMLPDGQRMLVTSAATDTLGMLNVDSLEFEKQPALGCTSVDLIWVPQ
jgi:YVTN family beta-propeller protein